jgi:hypothetical protein
MSDLEPIDGGWRVKTTPWGHIDLLRMLPPNWRLVRTPLDDPTCYDRGWCYTGPYALVAALAAAKAWDGSSDTEPAGWVRQVAPFTGRRRPDGDPDREYIAE